MSDLPQEVLSNQEISKSATTLFENWLDKTAEQCGYVPWDDKASQHLVLNLMDVQPVSPQHRHQRRRNPGSAPNGTEGNAAKTSGKRKIIASEPTYSTIPESGNTEVDEDARVSRFKPEAREVAKHPDIKLPSQVNAALKEAIEYRQLVTRWYEKHKKDEKLKNEQHRHFIEVLQEVVEILKPNTELIPAIPDIASHEQPSGSKSSKAPIYNQSKQSRSAIRLSSHSGNESGNRFSVLMSSASSSPLSSDHTKASPTAANDVTARNKSIETSVESGHSRKTLSRLGRFFHNMAKLRQFLQEKWTKYDNLASRNPMTRDVRKERDEHLMVTAMFTNLAIDIEREAEEDLMGEKNSLMKGWTLLELWSIISEGSKYPQSISPAEYAVSNEEKDSNNVGRMEKESDFLTQWLMELSLHYTIVRKLAYSEPHNRRKSGVLFRDEISKGYVRLHKDKELSMWMVFGARILQDIHNTVKDSENVYDVHDCKRVVYGMKIKSELDRRWERYGFGEEYCEAARHVHDVLISCQSSDKFSPIKREVLEGSQWTKIMRYLASSLISKESSSSEHELSSIRLSPSPDIKFIYSFNPLYTGTYMFRLALHAQHVGDYLQNPRSSIVLVAHLYNALLKTNLLREDWPEMNDGMIINKATWFLEEIPENEFLVHFCNRIRLPLASSTNPKKALKRSRRQKSGRIKADSYRSLSTKPHLIHLFLQYFDQLGPLRGCRDQLQASSQDPELALQEMGDYLHSELRDIQIDYIRLASICYQLLFDCSDKLRKNFDGKFDSLVRKILTEITTCRAAQQNPEVKCEDKSMSVQIAGLLDTAIGKRKFELDLADSDVDRFKSNKRQRTGRWV